MFRHCSHCANKTGKKGGRRWDCRQMTAEEEECTVVEDEGDGGLRRSCFQRSDLGRPWGFLSSSLPFPFSPCLQPWGLAAGSGDNKPSTCKSSTRHLASVQPHRPPSSAVMSPSTTTVRHFFDFISPFAYLCHHRLPSTLAAVPCNPKIESVPVLFAGLLRHWGQLGPAEVGGTNVVIKYIIPLSCLKLIMG